MGVLRLDLALAKLISKNMPEGARAGLVGWWRCAAGELTGELTKVRSPWACSWCLP